ncbi:MAG: hypothetical protein P4L10_09225 [Acidobacteriaceae bacterium]|nr:hypothetical protein [Acidobacteriaceae bacterium]
MNTTQGKLLSNFLESMRKYFEEYGEVTDCALMLDRLTGKVAAQMLGKSRGFGFVTFKDPTSVKKVLNDKPHTLDGKTVPPDF